MKKLLATLLVGMFGVILGTGGAFSGGPGIADAADCTVGSGYETIQAAIDDSDCATITVPAGTYNETLSIGRTLVLNGPNAGTSGLVTRVGEATITSTGPTITVTGADDVVIDGFAVIGELAINVNGPTNGVVIQNNVVTGTTRALTLDGANTGSRVLDNDLISDTRSLHVSTGPFSDLTVSGNRFSGAADTGIQFCCATDTIDGFVFTSNVVEHPANIGMNISNADVSDNTFDVDAAGSMNLQISLHDSTITDNSFDGNNTTGCLQIFGSQFDLAASDHVTVSGNTFTDCNVYGVQLSQEIHEITVTGNTFTNAVEAINTRASSAPLTTPWDVTGKNISIQGNSFSENGSNYGVRNTVTGALDASCNWWGASSGPGPIAEGSGARVSDGVTYAPWLVSASGDCNGLVGDDDGDGIANNVDPDPEDAGNEFSDIDAGGSTSGEIVSVPGGMSVVVTDALAPDGVRIVVNGGSSSDQVHVTLDGKFSEFWLTEGTYVLTDPQQQLTVETEDDGPAEVIFTVGGQALHVFIEDGETALITEIYEGSSLTNVIVEALDGDIEVSGYVIAEGNELNILDPDGDGVPAQFDACPSIAGSAGNGCAQAGGLGAGLAALFNSQPPAVAPAAQPASSTISPPNTGDAGLAATP